jgi:hypothetical protein
MGLIQIYSVHDMLLSHNHHFLNLAIDVVPKIVTCSRAEKPKTLARLRLHDPPLLPLAIAQFSKQFGG